MANEIKYGVKFDVDTSSLNQLKSSLQQIKKLDIKDVMKINNSDMSTARDTLRSVQEDAEKVEKALSRAFNTKLNTLNIATFNKELSSANLSIDKVQQSFSRIGVTGQAAFNNLATDILNTNVQLRQSSKLLDDMAVSMGNTIKWGITSSIFNTMTSSIQKAYYYAKDLDRSLTDIRIVTGDSADQMQRFAKVANTAAGDLGRSTLDYTKAALTFYQQGLGQQDVQARTEATLKAENITGIGQEMADYLTAVWNGFNVGAQDAEKYVDKLAAVADSTASNMGQLATGISKVASAANNVGVNIDQLTGQIATVIATTRQAPESVGVAFRTIYARINDIKAGTDEAQISLGNYSGKMAALGFNVLDATGHLRDTGQVIEEIGSRWQSLTKEQQINLAQVMAGQRQYSNLISLFDNWDKYLQSVNTSLNSQGTLNEKNDRYLESLQAHMQQLSTEAERTYDILFDEEAVKGWVDAFDGALNIFNDFIEGIGGGNTALAYFGTLVASIFNKQIVQAIQSAGAEIDRLKANFMAVEAKQEIIDKIKSGLQIAWAGQGQQLGNNALTVQAEAAEKTLAVQKGLTAEQQKQSIQIQKQIGLTQQHVDTLQRERVEREQTLNTYQKETGLVDASVWKIQAKREAQQEIVNELNNELVALNRIEQTAEDATLSTRQQRDLAKEMGQHYQSMRAIYVQQGGTIKDFNESWRKIIDYIHQGSNDLSGWQDIQARLSVARKEQQAELSKVDYILQNIGIDTTKLTEEQKKRLATLLQQNDALAEQGKQTINLQNIVRGLSSAGQILTSWVGAAKAFGDEMATAQQKANAVISGIQGTVMGIGSMFGPIGMGVATLTNGVISLMKEVTPFGDWLEDEFKTTKQRINEVNEAINQVNQNDKTKNAQISSLEALVDEYQRLSDKAGAYGINLDNLTKEQQDRYHDITNTFTEYNDAVIAGYDEQGNAIVRGQDALKDTIEVLKQAKLQADKAAMGDKNTFLGNVGLRYQDRGKKEFEQFDQDEADTNLQLQRLSTQGLDNVRAGLDNFVVNQKQIFKNLESLFYSDGVINSAKLEFLNGYNDLIETINTALVGGDTRTLIESLQKIEPYKNEIMAALGENNPFKDIYQAMFDYFTPSQEQLDLQAKLDQIAANREQLNQKLAEQTYDSGTAYALLHALQVYDNDTWSTIQDSLKQMGIGTEGFIKTLSDYITGQKVDDITVEGLYANIQEQAQAYASLLTDYGKAIDRSIQKAAEDAKSIFENKDQTVSELNAAIAQSINQNILNDTTIQKLLNDTEHPEYKTFLQDLISNIYNLNDLQFELTDDGFIAKVKTEGAKLKQDLTNALSETLVDSVDFDEFGKRIVTKGASADQISNFLDQFTDEQIKAVANAIDKEKIVFNDFNTFKDYVNEFLGNVQSTMEQQEAIAANYDRILSTGRKIAEGKTLTHKETSNLAKDLGISNEQLAQYRANGTQLQQIINAIKRTYAEGSDERVNAVSALFPTFEQLHAAHQQQIIDANDVKAAWNDVYVNELDALKISEQALESYAKARGLDFNSEDQKQEVLDLYKREQEWDKLGQSIEKAKEKLKEYTSESEAVKDTSALTYLQQLQELLHNLGLDVDYQWIIDNLEKIGQAAKGDLPNIDELKSVIESMSGASITMPEGYKEAAKGVQEKYKNYEDIQSKATKSGGSLTFDEYESLEPELQSYFGQMLDGTYKLIKAAEDFSNAVQQIQIDTVKQAVDQLNMNAAKMSGLQGTSFETLSKNASQPTEQSAYIDNSAMGIGGFPTADMSNMLAGTEELVAQQINYLELFGEYSAQQLQHWRNITPEAENYSQICRQISEQVQNTGDHTNELKEGIAASTQEALGLQYAFGNTAENMEQLQNMFDEGAISPEVFNSLAIGMQHLEDMQGLDANQVKQYAEYLEQTVDGLSDFEGAAQNVAVEILRMNKGVQTLSKNLDKWQDVLSNSTNTSYEYFEAMDQLKEAVSDLTGVSEDYLSDATLLNNMEDLKLAAEGDADAIDRLKMACAEDVIAKIVLDNGLDEAQIATVQSMWEGLRANMPDIEAGVTLSGQDQFIAALNELIAAAGMTAPQVNQMLSGMGFSATFANEPQKVLVKQPDLIEKHHEVTNFTEDEKTGAASWDEIETITYKPQPPKEGEIDAYAMATSEPGSVAVPQINSLTKVGGSANNYSGGNSGGSSPSGKSGGGGGGGKKGGGGGKGKKGGGGGKGKKGSGSDKQKQLKEKQKKEKREDQVDIYHDVNKELDNIERALSRLQKKQDKLWGKQLLDNLNKQSALLEQHKQKLQEKLALQQKDLANKRKDLELLGATFDEYGNISNYIELVSKKQQILNKLIEKYNQLVEKYNKATSEKKREDLEKRIQKFEKEIKDAEKQLDDLEDKVKDYDAIQEEMADVQDQIEDDIQQQIQINIKKFRMSIEIRLEMGEAERDWNKFVREVMHHTDVIKDSPFDRIFQDAKQHLDDVMSYFDVHGAGSTLTALADQMYATKDQIEQIDATGWASIYGDNNGTAMQDLQGDLDTLMSQLQDIESLLDDIDQAYLDTIDDVQDNFDKQIDDYEYVADLIEHDIDLLELLYGEKNYNAMNEYYTTLERNQTNQLDALRKQAEFWQKQWQDAAALGDTEAAKKFEENYRQALDNLNSVIEQAAETIQNKYINAIDNIFDKLDKKISGGLGTDYLDMQWQLMNKNAETYLDTINAAFAVQDLQRKYTKAINETQSIRNQQTLKKLMDEQLDNLREKEKISQYDVDRAEKMLQIEQARIALEDAQSSKTSLRLKRDAQGNYSYQYVSDADKVTEAQEKLAEAQNDLYNFDKQAYKSNLDEMLAAWQEFQDKYKQIVLDTSLTEEERIARLTELRENYATFINDKTAQNLDIRQNLIESAFMNIDKVYQQDVKNYQQMTAQQKEILMGELVPMWNSGIQQMSDKVAGDGGFIPACQDAFDRITEATKNYRDELDAMAQVAGVDLLSVRMGVDDLVFSFENLIMDNDELLGRMFEELTTIQSLRMQAQALMMQYKGVYESALAAASAIHEFIQAQRAQAAAEAEMAAQAQAQAQQAQAAAASSSGGGTQSGGNSGDYLIQQTKVKSTDGSGTLTIEEKIYPVGGSGGGGGKKGKAAKFDSGGYTGDWDTSDGKFAILHEKELVLNQSDTQNLLNSVQILRDLATNAQLGMSSRLSDVEVFRSAVFNGDKETIEQNVQITATFPNVNSKQQIEDAFNDLINLAAQRAMRNN